MLYFVSKYIPDGLYGFLENEERKRVFFHLSEFDSLGGPPSIPIAGEEVRIGALEPNGDKSPRARDVVRISLPEFFVGVVSRFDQNVGYGFVTVGEQAFFLHRSEFESGALPSIGAKVSFYASKANAVTKVPRACLAVLTERGVK